MILRTMEALRMGRTSSGQTIMFLTLPIAMPRKCLMEEMHSSRRAGSGKDCGGRFLCS